MGASASNEEMTGAVSEWIGRRRPASPPDRGVVREGSLPRSAGFRAVPARALRDLDVISLPSPSSDSEVLGCRCLLELAFLMAGFFGCFTLAFPVELCFPLPLPFRPPFPFRDALFEARGSRGGGGSNTRFKSRMYSEALVLSSVVDIPVPYMATTRLNDTAIGTESCLSFITSPMNAFADVSVRY